MKRKLYFMLPNIQTAQHMMDRLLLARIKEENIHFLAKPEISLEGLPEANVIEKTDSLHGVGMGAIVGGVIGVTGGLIVVAYPDLVSIPTVKDPLNWLAVPIIGSIGAAYGAWWNGMISCAIPNSSLKSYESEIARGGILMIVRAPYHRIRDIRALVQRECGEACNYVGVTPMEHVIFP